MTYIVTATFLVVVTPLLLSSAEPSAFGAGNLNDPNPYGLTQSEKVILETKKNLRKVEVKSNNQADAVESLRERLDGFQTIIESIGRKSYENKLTIQNLATQNKQEFQSSNEYDKRLSSIIQSNSESIEKIQLQLESDTQAIEKIKIAITELSKIVENINSKYVTHDELNILINDLNSFKSMMAKEITKGSIAVGTSPLDNMANSEIDSKAKEYFEKEKYIEALEYYNHLVKKNYRPANSHYHVGEIYFAKKNYAEAISYFKKSASLYSKASYMPNLMLHTALSMHRTKDYNNAKIFYNAIISKYPNSSESKEAFKQLSTME